MKGFTLSAFADEYSPDIEVQIDALQRNSVSLIEPRGINGKNISALSEPEAEKLAEKFAKAKIGISALGSPAGKAKIEDAFEHMSVFDNIVRVSKILGAKRIRGFSFYCDPEKDRDAVLKALDRMINIADKNGMLYCHENEKGIYGDTPERCADLLENFGGGMGCVFDPANFIQCGADPYDAFCLLKPHITYLHIKDAQSDGTVTAAGEGIGQIVRILTELSNNGSYPILTLEPHLKTFKGLSELENGEKTKIRTVFETNEEAFLYALDKLKEIINNIKTEDNQNG